MQLQPLGNHVIVMPALKEAKTASGIIIPDTADKERPERGTVVAVGPGKLLENGSRQSIEVSVGDVVVFKSYAGHEVEVEEGGEKKKQMVIDADEIVAIVK